MSTILKISTSAGDVELYEGRYGYFITNPKGHCIDNLGCGAFMDLDHAVNVASQIAATWQHEAEQVGG